MLPPTLVRDSVESNCALPDEPVVSIDLSREIAPYNLQECLSCEKLLDKSRQRNRIGKHANARICRPPAWKPKPTTDSSWSRRRENVRQPHARVALAFL